MTQERIVEDEEQPQYDDRHPLPEADTIEDAEIALAPDTPSAPRPLTPATPKKAPPLVRERDYVAVRVDREGYASVDGESRFVSRNLAGAIVRIARDR